MLKIDGEAYGCDALFGSLVFFAYLGLFVCLTVS